MPRPVAATALAAAASGVASPLYFSGSGPAGSSRADVSAARTADEQASVDRLRAAGCGVPWLAPGGPVTPLDGVTVLPLTDPVLFSAGPARVWIGPDWRLMRLELPAGAESGSDQAHVRYAGWETVGPPHRPRGLIRDHR